MDIDHAKLVVASLNDHGHPTFTDVESVWHFREPDVVEAAFFWEFVQPPMLPGDIGNAPRDMSFPRPGGSKAGLVRFAPRSAGKLDIAAALDGHTVSIDDRAPDLHQSDTVDIEFVLSGKIDIVLEGGATQTLVPGTCIVMGGIMHAWRNHYDEPCVVAIFLTGAQR